MVTSRFFRLGSAFGSLSSHVNGTEVIFFFCDVGGGMGDDVLEFFLGEFCCGFFPTKKTWTIFGGEDFVPKICPMKF